MPVHHLKPGGHCCGGGAGQHLGRAAVGEHVKAEWRLECCDNREFIVSVLSLLSNVILTSEEHSQLACPGAAIANFRFGIFALEPPKDL